MILSIPNNWNTARHQHNSFVTELIDKFLTGGGAIAKSKHTADFIKLVRPQVLSDKISDLNASIETLQTFKIRLTPRQYTRLLNDLRTIFNYDSFCKKHPTRWNAYTLCNQSQCRTCPYCNHNYALTVYQDEKGVFRPTLDHFYPKANYPHLALSLANLIPSCYSCNSSLKGDIDFFLHKHLHPLFDKENIKFQCFTPQKKITAITGNIEQSKKHLGLRLVPIIKCEATGNSLKRFALVERYEMLAFEAASFITAHITTEALVDQLATGKVNTRKNQTTLNFSPSAIKAHLLRFERSEYQHYLLGRLYADLHDQFKRRAP